MCICVALYVSAYCYALLLGMLHDLCLSLNLVSARCLFMSLYMYVFSVSVCLCRALVLVLFVFCPCCFSVFLVLNILCFCVFLYRCIVCGFCVLLFLSFSFSSCGGLGQLLGHHILMNGGQLFRLLFARVY